MALSNGLLNGLLAMALLAMPPAEFLTVFRKEKTKHPGTWVDEQALSEEVGKSLAALWPWLLGRKGGWPSGLDQTQGELGTYGSLNPHCQDSKI